ncbi:MAG: TMEM165/GDT1 family protein [Candidatus Omnitrophota bacterium]
MAALIASFIFVFLAEMADKTQLLVMAFASRYSASKVLIAVFLAAILNFSLAVAAGYFLTVVIPMHIISFVAGLSFIVFGLWAMRAEKPEKDGKINSRFGPILTVAIAFFIAEMGDKTQLATMSLAVQYREPVSVLLGATLGIVIADALGIIVGLVLRRHLPERVIRFSSAAIFILFGFLSMYKVMQVRFDPIQILLVLSITAVLTALAASCILQGRLSNQR